ncbi:MAG: hypothetical protein NC117_04180 [Pseudoflavonifractor sp.]|nr:hypothetical protein [Pseudoflavonifractor sp.]
MDSRPDERFDLYDRFVADLREGRLSDMFYDESDIVEIYDYAGDNEDEYVKLEALLYGARLYPDSSPLAVRRAYYYYHNNDDDAAAKLVERYGSDTVLWNIMRLKLSKDLMGADAIPAMERIFETAKHLDDEEVIQLVAVAEEKGIVDTLRTRAAEIVEKCEYPATFYYELGTVYDSVSEHKTAASLFEEATMVEPFNSMFWDALARTCYNEGDWERALNAADYALAIDDKSDKVIFIRLAAMARMKKDLPQVTKRLEELYRRQKPGVEQGEIAEVLMYCHEMEGDRAKAIALAREMNQSYPDERIWVDYMLIYEGDTPDGGLLDRYYNSIGGNCETEWLNWSTYCVSIGRHDSAVAILLALKRHGELRSGYSLLFESLYRLGRYEDVIGEFTRIDKGAVPGQYWWRPEIVLMVILSMIQTDDVDDGIAFARDVAGMGLSPAMDFQSQIAWHGTLRAIRDIIAAHEASGPVPVSDIDPFSVS